MRIAYVVGYPTQFEVPFYRFIENVKGKNEFLVIYVKNNKEEKDYELGKYNSWGFNLSEGYYSIHLDTSKAQSAFEKLLTENNFDLIIFNGYKEVFDNLIKVAKRFNKKISLRLDTVLFNKSKFELFIRRIFLSKIYRQFDSFLVTGSVSKNYLTKMNIPDSKIHVFSYCTDPLLFVDRKNIAENQIHSIKNNLKCKHKKILLVVSKLIERETPWDVINAFIYLNNSAMKLIIIGDGYQKRMVEKIIKRNSNLDIELLGYVPYLHLPQYYQIADVFIHAAKDEPWGVSVQEAIQCGAAVITSDHVGSAADLIIEDKNGKVYPYGEFKKLSHAIMEVLNYDRNQIEAANSKVLEKWNYQWMWNQILYSVNS